MGTLKKVGEEVASWNGSRRPAEATAKRKNGRRLRRQAELALGKDRDGGFRFEFVKATVDSTVDASFER